MPASTSSSLTHSSRNFSARAAMRWSPAAPISPRAFFVKSRSRSGLRDSAWRSSRRRRADGDLVLPGDVEREAVLAEQLLLGLALVRAGDVRGRHGDQMARAEPVVDHGGGHPGGPEQVDLDRLGQGGVEGDGGGGVDDDVGGGQRVPPVVVEAEAVAPDVAGDGPDPAGDLVGELVAELAAQAVEAVVLDHLAGEPGGGVGPAPGPDQDGHLGVGDAAEDALDQGGAQEAGGAGDEETLPAEVPLDGHRKCLPPRRRICLPFGK